MEDTISLKEIFDMLQKHIMLICVAFFGGIILSAMVTFFLITPQYSSRAQLIVSLPETEAVTNNVNDVNFNLQMLNTYKDIIKESDALAKNVQAELAKKYDVHMTISGIKNSLHVTQSPNSQMFSISATNEQAKIAKELVNTATAIFKRTVSEVLMNVKSIAVISPATASTHPVSPNHKLHLAIGAALGLIVGVALAFLSELLNRTVKSSDFISDKMEIPVIGLVPQVAAKDRQFNKK